MAKSNCTPPTSNDQGTTPLYHHGTHIDSPSFDLEDSFCARLNKLRGLADMFLSMGNSSEIHISKKGAFGIHELLEDTSEELRTICYHMLNNQEVTR